MEAKRGGDEIDERRLIRDESVSEEARTHFKAGVSLLQDPEGEWVEEAYREFKAAYAISKSPKMLGNMGFCAMRLERVSALRGAARERDQWAR